MPVKFFEICYEFGSVFHAGDERRVTAIGANMPAKSKKQQMAAGAALAAKRGEQKKSSLKGASKEMEKSMSEKQLEDFAKTKRKGLPRKKAAKS